MSALARRKRIQANAVPGLQGRSEEYNPQETDVWASGIMLTVCLLGAFPFDHSAANMPGSTEDELDLWCAACSSQGGSGCP